MSCIRIFSVKQDRLLDDWKHEIVRSSYFFQFLVLYIHNGAYNTFYGPPSLERIDRRYWSLGLTCNVNQKSVVAPPPLRPPFIIWGDLIWKFTKLLWGQSFFFHMQGDKPLWRELKLYGGILITTLSLFNFFGNSETPRKVKCFF